MSEESRTPPPDEDDPWLGISRRSFIAQLGIASVASFASAPGFSLAAHELNRAPAETLASSHVNPIQEPHTMPLVRIDAFEGRSDAEVKTLLDSAHRAMVKALHLNERDRYQIYDARPKSHFVVQDTGLGIARTEKALIITVVSKARPEILKRRLYKEMTEELARSASIPPSDVMMVIVENAAADWTFGNGDAQFLTGDLG
jgi:phenylpyruvate tautomerase PptA (4-oxalocrotonate tautomerase family)